jgi:membrane protease YdiL (CAAX protease family)
MRRPSTRVPDAAPVVPDAPPARQPTRTSVFLASLLSGWFLLLEYLFLSFVLSFSIRVAFVKGGIVQGAVLAPGNNSSSPSASAVQVGDAADMGSLTRTRCALFSSPNVSSSDDDAAADFSVAEAARCVIESDFLGPPLWFALVVVSLRVVPMLAFLRFRYWGDVMAWPAAVRALKGKLGFSAVGWTVLLLIPVEAAVIGVLRSGTGTSFWSTDALSPKGTWDWAYFFLLVVMTPLLEETVFRLLLPTVLVRSSLKPQTALPLSCVLFGMFHLLNALGSTFSAEYIALQILLGSVTGAVFAIEAYTTSITSSFVLHMINNLASALLISSKMGTERSILSPESRVDWSNSAPMLLTAVVHTWLLVSYWPAVSKKLSAR